jgi:hypothetical protein
MTRGRLQRAFKSVKETFFPRWDREKQWRLEFGPSGRFDGRCDRGTKTITYCRGEPHLVLAHEICHAIGGENHGAKWAARLSKVAERAYELGMESFADAISKELELYLGSSTKRTSDVYGVIEDAVLGAPRSACETVLDWVASEAGMEPHQLEDAYKGCRKAYRKAIRKLAALTNRHGRDKTRGNGSY